MAIKQFTRSILCYCRPFVSVPWSKIAMPAGNQVNPERIQPEDAPAAPAGRRICSRAISMNSWLHRNGIVREYVLLRSWSFLPGGSTNRPRRQRWKSQRDFIIQPGVDAQRLRRETDHRMKSILKELNRCARNSDATALR
jgi:hypothetical protein